MRIGRSVLISMLLRIICFLEDKSAKKEDRNECHFSPCRSTKKGMQSQYYVFPQADEAPSIYEKSNDVPRQLTAHKNTTDCFTARENDETARKMKLLGIMVFQ